MAAKKRRPGKRTGMRSRGRPSLLTGDVSRIICTAIEGGQPLKYAAASAGIGEATVHEWLARGDDPEETDPRYADFRASVHKARQAKVQRLIEGIEQAGHTEAPGQWRALAWLLERTEQGDFNGKTQVEHTGPGGGPVVDLAQLTAAAADRLREIEEGENDE